MKPSSEEYDSPGLTENQSAKPLKCSQSLIGMIETEKNSREDRKKKRDGSIWEVGDRVTLGFDFYQKYYLNLPNDGYKVSVLNAVVGFQRLAMVLQLQFPRSTAETIISLQDWDTQMITWANFWQALNSFETRTRFKRRSIYQRNSVGMALTSRISLSKEFSLSTETVIFLSTMEKIHVTLGGRAGNVWSLAYNGFLFFVNAASVIALSLESLPSMKDLPVGCTTFEDDVTNPACAGEPTLSMTFWYIEAVTACVLLWDYLVHLVLAPFVRLEIINSHSLTDIASYADRVDGFSQFNYPATAFRRLVRFLVDPLYLMNLVSILPFFIILFIKGPVTGPASDLILSFGVLRALRLVIMFRLISFGHFREIKTIMNKTIKSSFISLVILLLIYIGLIVFFAVLVFLPEKGAWYPKGSVVNTGGRPISYGGFYRPTGNDPRILELSPFSSIPASMWWAVVTATTVGYGDVTPATVGGKIVGYVLAIGGVIVIAFPLAVIGLNFSNEYTKFYAVKTQISRSEEREAQERAIEKLRLQPHHDASPRQPTRDGQIHHDKEETSALKDADASKSPSSDALMREARAVSANNEKWNEILDSFEKLTENSDTRTGEGVQEFVRSGLMAIASIDSVEADVNGQSSGPMEVVERSRLTLLTAPISSPDRGRIFQTLLYRLAIEALQRAPTQNDSKN